MTPLDFLKMDIAARHSQDKANWDIRLEWFHKNEDDLDNLVSSADEPAQFVAAVQAYRDTMSGLPTGYLVSLDCSNSGLQILSAITGDEKGAAICNVTGNERVDGYTIIYETTKELCGSDRAIKRDHVKKAVMTAFYGSQEEPIKIFGDGTKELEAFYAAMEHHAPLCWELNKIWLSVWDPSKVMYSWVLPDNFHVECPVQNTVQEDVTFMGESYTVSYKVNAPTEKGRFLSANTTHSIEAFLTRELIRRTSTSQYIVSRVSKLIKDGFKVTTSSYDDHMVMTLWDLYLKSGFLSARILPHLGTKNIKMVDPKVVLGILDTIPNKPFNILTIHDCYKCHPVYAQDLINTYRHLFVELAQSNMLKYVMSQVVGVDLNINKGSTALHEMIKQSEYIIS